MAYWQGRFSNCYFCLMKISFVITFLVLQDASCVKTYDPVLKDFPDSVLQRHITVSRHHPVCVLFRQPGKGSRLEKNLHSVWRNTTETIANFTTWEVGSFVFKQDRESLVKERRPDELPTLRCYLGQSYYQEYTGKPRLKNLKVWIESLVKHHSEQLQDATPTLVDKALEIYNVVVVAFPDTIRHVEIEEMSFQACEKSTSCKAFIVHAHSIEARELKQKFQVYDSPAVVVVHKTGDGEKYKLRRFIKHHVSKINLDVYIQAREISVRHSDYKTFESDVLESAEKKGVPVLVGFYGSWPRNIHSYLAMYKRSYEEFKDLQARLKFALLDLNEQDNRKVITKWIHAPFAQKVPFTILFHKDQKNGVSQYSLTDNRPTPLSIYTMMKESGVELMDGQREIIDYNPWGYWDIQQMSMLYEGPYGSMCGSQSHNQTDNNPQYYWKKWKINKKRKTKKNKDNKKWHQQFSSENLERHLEKMEGIPVITGTSWSEMIEKSHAPSHPFLGGKQWAGEVTKVAMVVFMITDCRSCKSSMTILKDIQQSIRFIEGGSLYIVNCTHDKDLCLHHRVRGFPTITAFRGLGWLGTSQCVSAQSQKKYKNYIRLDYHGVIQVNPIMEWFMIASGPAVDNRMLNWPQNEDLNNDVTVTGILMPRATRFLPIPPNRNPNYYFSYQCFRLVCERLYGKAKCFGVYSKDIPQKEFSDEDIDVIVSKVIMERKDGVSAVIMQLGKTLKSTLDEETDPLVHKFHRPHRYNFKDTQKCEDNHASCTDIITSFTIDHSRLPITMLTSTSFHTSDSEQLEEDMPVLIALVHPDNITGESHFLKVLTDVAYEMYNDLMVTTLDVDQYTAWAGQFIPVNYRRKLVQDDWDPGKLFTYPRLCFIQKQNHRKAAFYPPINKKRNYETQFTTENIIDFAKKFIQHPTRYLVQTEHF